MVGRRTEGEVQGTSKVGVGGIEDFHGPNASGGGIEGGNGRG